MLSLTPTVSIKLDSSRSTMQLEIEASNIILENLPYSSPTINKNKLNILVKKLTDSKFLASWIKQAISFDK